MQMIDVVEKQTDIYYNNIPDSVINPVLLGSLLL